MKTQLLIGCKSAKEAHKLAPWASVIKKVDGGYMAWESRADFDVWKAQK